MMSRRSKFRYCRTFITLSSFSYEKLCVGQPINFKNTTESSSKLRICQWEINGLVDTTYDLVEHF